jgi:hypothetical protein
VRCRHCNYGESTRQTDNPTRPAQEPQPEKTIGVFMIEETPMQEWRSSLTECTRDPKSFGAANYLRCQDACDTFPGEVIEFDVAKTTSVADLIFRYAGERPRTYTREELRKAISAPADGGRSHGQRRAHVNEETLDLAVRLATETPSLALFCRGPGERQQDAIWSGTVGGAGFDEGDVLTLRRKSPADILSEAKAEIVCRPCACAEPLRDATQFFELVKGSDALDTPVSDDDDWYFGRRGRPQRVMLLYTEDDVHVASYVRTHFDMLDKASGDLCDVYFIENPGAVGSSGFWM